MYEAAGKIFSYLTMSAFRETLENRDLQLWALLESDYSSKLSEKILY